MLGDSMGLPPVQPQMLPMQQPMQPQMQPMQPQMQPMQPQMQQPGGPAMYGNGYPMLQPPPGASGVQPALPGPYGDYGRPMASAYGAQRPPRISRRTLLLIGAAGLAIAAAVLTVVIIQAAAGDDATEDKAPAAAADTKPVAVTPAPAPTKPTVESIKPPTVTPIPPPEPAKPEPQAVAPPEPTPPEPTPPEPTPPEPPKATPKAKIATSDPSAAARKREAAAAAKREREEAAERKREAAAAKRDQPRVATDTSGVKDKADALYRAKNFSGAARALRAAAKGDDATELKSLAAVYENFGKAYNVGMAPGTSAKQAFDLLTKAKNYDNRAGNAFTSAINARLAEIAPKAAVAFMADKNYARAKTAVAIAEAGGKGNSSTQGVKASLESAASKLYKQAQSEMSSDEKSARDKLKQVQQMVPSSSQWHQKAAKLLASG
jgi:outer membrane biosynthesis protein TonB